MRRIRGPRAAIIHIVFQFVSARLHSKVVVPRMDNHRELPGPVQVTVGETKPRSEFLHNLDEIARW